MTRVLSLPPWLVIIALLISLYATQVAYDSRRLEEWALASIPVNELIEPTIPNFKVTKYLTFGNQNVVADMLWLSTIQYYGGGDPYGKYRQLPGLIQNILTLDPKFHYPYDFTGIVLPSEGFADQALNILRNGETALPDDWMLPYDEGTIYLINKKDPSNAATAFDRAATKPGAPTRAKFLEAVGQDQSNNYTTAKVLFAQIATSSDNAYFKDRAQAFVDHYALLEALTTVINNFNQKEHRYPASLQELVDKHYVPQIPPDPLNRPIKYDPATGQVTSKIEK